MRLSGRLSAAFARCTTGLHRPLSQTFQELAAASDGQLEVLARVAELVGLEDLDLSKPLQDEASEALAQPVAWRPTARWVVLSLLWALPELAVVAGGPVTITPSQWAQVVCDGRSKRPRGGTSLHESDEELALTTAAKSLAGLPVIKNGSGSLVLSVPLVIRGHDDGSIAAKTVRPIALVETSSELLSIPIELRAGDRVWPAERRLEDFSVGDAHQRSNGVLTMTGEGKLFADDSQVSAVGVVRHFVLLHKGQLSENGS